MLAHACSRYLCGLWLHPLAVRLPSLFVRQSCCWKLPSGTVPLTCPGSLPSLLLLLSSIATSSQCVYSFSICSITCTIFLSPPRRTLSDMTSVCAGMNEACAKFMLGLPGIEGVKMVLTEAIGACPNASFLPPQPLLRAMTGGLIATWMMYRSVVSLVMSVDDLVCLQGIAQLLRVPAQCSVAVALLQRQVKALGSESLVSPTGRWLMACLTDTLHNMVEVCGTLAGMDAHFRLLFQQLLEMAVKLAAMGHPLEPEPVLVAFAVTESEKVLATTAPWTLPDPTRANVVTLLLSYATLQTQLVTAAEDGPTFETMLSRFVSLRMIC